MKKIMLLVVLMMASGLGEEGVALSNQAAAPGARFGARPVYENGTEYQLNAHAEKNHGNEKKIASPWSD